MKEKRGIAFRRHHYKKLKLKVLRLKYWNRDSNEWSKELLGIAINTPKIKSSTLCTMNPRKIEGKSIQEKRSIKSSSCEYKGL